MISGSGFGASTMAQDAVRRQGFLSYPPTESSRGAWGVGVVLACYLTAGGASNGHVDPNATDNQSLQFPRVPSLGAAGCGGLGSRGDFYFQGRLYAI